MRAGSKEGQATPMSNRRGTVVLLALVTATVLAFSPAIRNGFIPLDDHSLILKNAHLREGFTLPVIRWSLTTLDYPTWFPVTWWAHILNVRLFELRPGPHHLMSILYHALAIALLFLALRAMSGRLWASAFAAALFGLHPLRVESVAWAAELKDPLSGCFFALSLLAYTRFARRPTLSSYGVLVVAFTLGLMSKPTIVPLPFLLLVLDFWPLRRWQPSASRRPGEPSCGATSPARLVGEKIPLLALAAALSFVTYQAQASGGAVGNYISYPLPARLANAVFSSVRYLSKFFWPAKLSAFYPHPAPTLSTAEITAACGLIILLTVLALVQARRRPYLITGWLWYLLFLVPVSGIVQVGLQGMADRYTYLPLIGVAIALVWMVGDCVRMLNEPSISAVAGAASLLVALAVATGFQTGYWRDGTTLFRHALDVTGPNWFALYGAGVSAVKEGRLEEAVSYYQRSLELMPHFSDTHLMLGNALFRLGEPGKAIPHYRLALPGPNPAVAHYNLGLALLRTGGESEAGEEFRAALRLRPDFAEARQALAGTPDSYPP